MSEDEGDLLRWASRLFETLESANNPRPRVVAATAGFLVTAGMWLVHLSYPSLILELGLLARGIVVAPPLVSVMSIGYLVFPEITEERDVETGPMSGYMRMVTSDRRWKITVTATATGAAQLDAYVVHEPGGVKKSGEIRAKSIDLRRRFAVERPDERPQQRRHIHPE